MTSARLIVFDLDGTLYRGAEPIPHAADTVNQLAAQGKYIAYATNNATATPQFFAEKLVKMGYPAEPSQVFTSATAATSYCTDHKFTRVGVFGEDALVTLLQNGGCGVNGPEEPWPLLLDAVVAGLYRSFRYDHVAKAMAAIRNGATFVATNGDTTFPLEGGTLVPGAGAGIAAIEACTGQEPVVMGKPNPFMLEEAMRAFAVAPAETLVVGDRYNTDILAGLAAGCHVWMVLTGVDSSAPEGIQFSEDLRGLLA